MLSTLAVGYLFLGGAGAGACVVASILALLVPREELHFCEASQLNLSFSKCAQIPQMYRRFFAPVYAVAACVLALGSFMLLIDLGNIDSVFMLFLFPSTTWLSIGAFALVVVLVLSFFLAAYWAGYCAFASLQLLRFLECATIVFALLVALYTGLLLSTIGTVPLWNNLAIPVLFVLSSLSCGCAVMAASAVFSSVSDAFSRVLSRVLRFDLLFLLLELVAAVAFIALCLAQPYAVAVDGVHNLLFGEFALPFVVGFLVCGIVLPGILETGVVHFGIRNQAFLPIIAVLVLVGALCMRYAIVCAAAHPAVWIGA